jgi:pimeloyl-ACP methyl ester carboxylesterase
MIVRAKLRNAFAAIAVTALAPPVALHSARAGRLPAMPPAPIAGDWDGRFDFGNGRTARVAFHLVKPGKGQDRLRIDLIDKGFWGIPASLVDQTGAGITFEFAVIGARFEGRLDRTGRTIVGRWSEGGYRWAARFTRHPSRTPIATQPVDHDYDVYLRPQQMIRLPSGRSIHLVCVGQGSPTVIFTAGNGFWSDTWRKIQPRIGRTTRACAWDRAGFGFSDASSDAQDVLNTTNDLEATLTAAGVAGPYVMVGHSLGSSESLLYTDRHPAAVAGMVLIEPAFPDQFDMYRKQTPAYANAIRVDTVAFDRKNDECVAYLRQPEADPFHAEAVGCYSIQPFEPIALAAEIARRDRAVSRAISRAGFYRNTEADARIIRNPSRQYGDMPLAVLMARDETPSNASDQDAKTVVGIWRTAREALAALSTRGTTICVPGRNHFLQDESPDRVIDAINRVIAEARATHKR